MREAGGRWGGGGRSPVPIPRWAGNPPPLRWWGWLWEADARLSGAPGRVTPTPARPGPSGADTGAVVYGSRGGAPPVCWSSLPRGEPGTGRAVPAGNAGLRHVSGEPRGFRGLTAVGSPAGPRLASGGAVGTGRALPGQPSGRRGDARPGRGLRRWFCQTGLPGGAEGAPDSALPGCGNSS